MQNMEFESYSYNKLKQSVCVISQRLRQGNCGVIRIKKTFFNNYKNLGICFNYHLNFKILNVLNCTIYVHIFH